MINKDFGVRLKGELKNSLDKEVKRFQEFGFSPSASMVVSKIVSSFFKHNGKLTLDGWEFEGWELKPKPKPTPQTEQIKEEIKPIPVKTVKRKSPKVSGEITLSTLEEDLLTCYELRIKTTELNRRLKNRFDYDFTDDELKSKVDSLRRRIKYNTDDADQWITDYQKKNRVGSLVASD